jgi:hypothetical protein
MGKKEINHHIQQLLNIYAKTCSTGKEIDCLNSSSEIIRYAKKDEELYKYTKDIYFCCYKCKFKKKNAIMFLFSLNLPGSVTGSSSASDMIMELIGIMEDKFYPIESTTFNREIDSNNKSIGLVKLIKYVEGDI